MGGVFTSHPILPSRMPLSLNLIERLGFEWFFVATSLIGVPVAALCWYVWRRRQITGTKIDLRGVASQTSLTRLPAHKPNALTPRPAAV
jgi:hypothetical protein